MGKQQEEKSSPESSHDDMKNTSLELKRIDHKTPEERSDAGKAARATVPRSMLAAWDPPADRPDPIDLLEGQALGRVPELVPIRYGRMLTSPFAFYRGAAVIMASDLALMPNTGLNVQLCGDAHLSNFGGFGSPERELILDLNDFDETLPGPWEWDVKRLAASLEIASRERNFDSKTRRSLVSATVGEYQSAMREFAELRNLDMWYLHLSPEAISVALGDIGQTQGNEIVRSGFCERLPKR